MTMFRRCETCGKKKFWFLIKQRKVRTPIGLIATSKKLMCANCVKRVEKALKQNESRLAEANKG